MPNKVKLVHPHSKSMVTFNLSLEKFFCPIQITLVFFLFNFKPDTFPYISRVFRVNCKECWLSFSISVFVYELLVTRCCCHELNANHRFVLNFTVLGLQVNTCPKLIYAYASTVSSNIDFAYIATGYARPISRLA